MFKKWLYVLLVLLLTCNGYAADTALSALTELATTPANSDEIYINDGGVSKKITVTNLLDHKLDASGAVSLNFTPQETVAHAEGTIYYDSDDDTFKLYNAESDVALDLGEEQWIFCRNTTGATIVNGTAVYISGATGQVPLIALADADLISTAKLIGLVTHDIENNTNGYVTTTGVVRDLDTDGSPVAETWLAGDKLWLSSTAGSLTNIEPAAPVFAVCVGFVRYAHTTSGNLYINPSARIKNGSIGTPASGGLVNCTGYTADDVEMAELGTATYDDLQDWANNTQSSGKISGGAFGLLNGTGTLDVAAGTGLIRATNSDIAEVLSFDWAQNAAVVLTDNQTNYIYVDYNDGITILVSATTTKSTIDNRTKILLGKVYREGTVLHEVEAGMVITELAKRVLTYLNGLNGEIVRFTGLTVSETGTLNIAITEGAGSAGLTPLSWSAIDTSGADDFRYWYNNGTWQESTVSVISNTQYNNYGVGLATILPNQYARMEVYEHFEGDLHVVYGIGTYTLAEALAAPQLANLPDIVKDFSLYIGGIIIERDEASTFTDVLTPWNNTVSGGTVTSHTSLSDLNTASHAHVTSTIAGYLDPTSSVQTQIDSKEGTLTNEAGLYAALTDVTNFTQSSSVETITGDWVNTTHPWADNEVADDITVTDASQISSLSVNGEALVEAANYAAMRVLLDLEAGTDFYSKTAIDTDFPFATFPTTPASAPDADYEVANKKYVDDNSGGSASISDVVYGVGWNGDTTNGASKNALYDKIETLGGGFDSTSVDAPTWSDGANASNIWTFDLIGTDTTLTLGSGLFTFSHDLTSLGDITGTDFIIGTTSLTEATSAVDSGAYLLGVFDEFDNSSSSTGQGVLNDLDTAITGKEGDLSNEAGLYAALSDVTNFTQPGIAETLTANWVNTANPWADNEVDDGITITDASQISSLSANGEALIEAVDYAAMRVLLDLEIGTDVQAYDATNALTTTKLDDFATPDDNTDLDATIVQHGLLPKLGGGSTNYLRADGTWATPPGSGGGFDSTAIDATTWSDGANASNVWTFDVSGTDTTLTFGSGEATFSHALTSLGDITGTDFLIGTTALTETTSATDSGAYLTGVFDEFDNSASSTVQEVLNDFDDIFEPNDSTYTGLDVNGSTALFSHTWTPAINGTISAVRSGLIGTTHWDSAYNMGTAGHIIGVLGTVQASGTGVGTLELCLGIEGAIYPNNGNATINKAIGVGANLFTGSATVNNFYGFYLGDTPKDATNMYSLYSAETEAFFFHSGSGAFYGGNKAGGSSNTLELNPTIVAMDGSDTIRGLNININGTPTHTGTGNLVVGLEIDGLQAQHANAYEAAMYIGTEWDYHLLSEGDFNFAPSFDFDDYFVFKTVSNEPTIATSGTSNLILAPDSGVTEVTGDLVVSGDIEATTLDVTTVQASAASVTVGGTSDDVHIALDGAPDADDSYSGTTIRGKNAGETTAQWDLVYFDTTDSEWKIADANVSGEWPAWGMGVATGADGAELVILQKGVVRNDAWNWTVGAALYLDETTPGGMTETAPSTTGDCIQPVGLALTADVVLIDINAMYGYGESS